MKHLRLILAVLLCFLILPRGELQAAFPEKPITIIVHSKPGSAIDITTRQLANIARRYCPQPILVENKSGGSGIVAMRTVLSKPADGYTVLAVTKSFISTVLLTQSGVKMDDFYFLACMVVDPEALITNRHSRVRTLEDIIRDAKEKNGHQRWLGPLVGGVDHLMAVKTWEILGIKGEWIPYEGGSDALAALMGKQGAVYVGNPVDVLGRPDLMVAVVAAPQRLPLFPETPTFVEKGFPLEHEVLWRGYAVKKGTNSQAIDYLNHLFYQISQDSTWLAFVHSTAAQPVFWNHQTFTQNVVRDQKEAIKYLEKAGILQSAAPQKIRKQLQLAGILAVAFLLLVLLVRQFKRDWLTSDFVIGLFMIFLGAYLYILTFDFPQGKLTATVGPASMPRLWIYALWIFSLWLIVLSLKNEAPSSNSTSAKQLKIPLRLVGLMLFYVLLVPLAGYYITTFLFLIAGAYALNYRKHLFIFATAGAYLLFSYLVFFKVLRVPLPLGEWWY